MKKLLFVTFLAALAGAAFGQEAVFKEVKGKVEYKLAGKTWQPAQINAAIPKGSSVSTGFKSSAVLLVNGSLLIVKPLTNLTIEEITKNQDGPQTTVYLVAGKVKTEVKPSVGTEVTNFTVKNPTATASVRGTGFEFDGESILVNHGSVELFNRYEIARFVEGGEIATAGSGASVPPPIPVKPPTAPVLTAEGGTEEVDQAVGQMRAMFR